MEANEDGMVGKKCFVFPALGEGKAHYRVCFNARQLYTCFADYLRITAYQVHVVLPSLSNAFQIFAIQRCVKIDRLSWFQYRGS